MIELKSKLYWIKVCKTALFSFKYNQQYQNALFENKWYDRFHSHSKWKKYFFGPLTKFPPENFTSFEDRYPSWVGDYWIEKIESVLSALENLSVGKIYVDDKLYDVLSVYE